MYAHLYILHIDFSISTTSNMYCFFIVKLSKFFLVTPWNSFVLPVDTLSFNGTPQHLGCKLHLSAHWWASPHHFCKLCPIFGNYQSTFNIKIVFSSFPHWGNRVLLALLCLPSFSLHVVVSASVSWKAESILRCAHIIRLNPFISWRVLRMFPSPLPWMEL